MVETMGFQEGPFACESQFSALIEIVGITCTFEHIAKTDVFRVEGRQCTGGITIKRRKQRDPTLRSHHTCNGIASARQLFGVGEIGTLRFMAV
ncbi:hypothetical protein SRABI106_03793 [Rahnella aquatilis]|nr:hypothetical protein SRABI106_03793 [Rahnella aquatilis]